MKRLARAILRLLEEPRPTCTVRHYSSAEYLRSRNAGANTVRVEGAPAFAIKEAGER